MKSQQELFDDLYKEVQPERYSIVLRKLADAANANAKVTDLQAAVDMARDAYQRAMDAHHLAWKEAWVAARDEMVTEKQ